MPSGGGGGWVKNKRVNKSFLALATKRKLNGEKTYCMNLCKGNNTVCSPFHARIRLTRRSGCFFLFNKVALLAPAENPRLIIIIFKCPTITLQFVGSSLHHLAKWKTHFSFSRRPHPPLAQQQNANQPSAWTAACSVKQEVGRSEAPVQTAALWRRCQIYCLHLHAVPLQAVPSGGAPERFSDTASLCMLI